MKIPLGWLENYIKLRHSPEEFGDIMTSLEFMQDGPVEKAGEHEVIDLEVRQNRPDVLSIIGVAREYGAYISEDVDYPKQLNEIAIDWEQPNKNLVVHAKNIVKRFCTVEIKNIKIKRSPVWMRKHLESYGIPTVNNIVDITNYVMLEYGMPLHAFDIRKLKKEKGQPLLCLRKAKNGENFKTWQGTEIELTHKDLVVADSSRPVAMAGIIGGANSDIDDKTKTIILESAVYSYAQIRRTSLRHSIRTEASTRHEKFLNPEMVETAIRRSLYLIKELTGGELVKLEDFYEVKPKPIVIEFNINEVTRIGGVQLSEDEISNLLARLGFDVIKQKQAIGPDKNIFVVRVPIWRTDVKIEADLVEEVLRLWGYDKIPNQEISSAPPIYSTPKDILLEEKIRDIFVKLGLDEYVTNPLVKFTGKDKQIKLENPLNREKDGLRTTIKETLKCASEASLKSGLDSVAIFEIGKVYKQKKMGEYIEEKIAEAYYVGFSPKKIKKDFLSALRTFGIDRPSWKFQKDELIYSTQGKKIAILRKNGFEFLIENIANVTDVKKIPYQQLQISIPQKMEEEISLIISEKQVTGEISEIIQESSNYIASIEVIDTYKGVQIPKGKKSITLKILFEDYEKQLTQKKIEEIKSLILKSLSSKCGAKLRK